MQAVLAQVEALEMEVWTFQLERVEWLKLKRLETQTAHLSIEEFQLGSAHVCEWWRLEQNS